jgi:hypothetical protein
MTVVVKGHNPTMWSPKKPCSIAVVFVVWTLLPQCWYQFALMLSSYVRSPTICFQGTAYRMQIFREHRGISRPPCLWIFITSHLAVWLLMWPFKCNYPLSEKKKTFPVHDLPSDKMTKSMSILNCCRHAIIAVDVLLEIG